VEGGPAGDRRAGRRAEVVPEASGGAGASDRGAVRSAATEGARLRVPNPPGNVGLVTEREKTRRDAAETTGPGRRRRSPGSATPHPRSPEADPGGARPQARSRRPRPLALTGSRRGRATPAPRPRGGPPLTFRDWVCYAALDRDAVSRPEGGFMSRWSISGGIALLALALGCHHEVEMVPLAERTIYTTDRFYDVQAVSKDGRSWSATAEDPRDDERRVQLGHANERHRPRPLRRALPGRAARLHLRSGRPHPAHRRRRQDVAEAGVERGLPGQGRLQAVAVPLRAVRGRRRQRVAVGDRSILTSTHDGGRTWRLARCRWRPT